jgi:photosystem II stability/assembly factor-like uncharacterized protein
MKNKITKLGLLLLLTVAMVACVSATSITKIAGDSWKEEIELHDGSTMIIKRTQHYKGRHEIGQAVPVGEHTVSFTLPQTGKSYTWTSEYGEELGRTNFQLVAVHVLDNTPYIVVTPNRCFSYNKWGRPNPPYVIFKHDGSTWQRIPLSELPPMFTTINVLVSITDKDTRGISSMRTISAATIKARNSELSQPEYKTLLREPIKGGGDSGCPEMIRYKCGWGGPGEFNRKYFERVCK